MNVTVSPIVLAVPQPKGHARTPGIHVSAIIKCIATEAGILKKELVEDLSLLDASQEAWWEQLDEVSRLRISIGLAWEEWYLPQIGDVVDHPGEMCVQGIYMTHDGESLSVIITPPFHTLCLHEVKATYKSIKTVGTLESQWMWVAQCKAYCKGLGTRVAFLHVLFLCGDYTYPMRPKGLIYRIEFTQEEIDESWELLTDYVTHRQLMDREPDAGLEGGV